MTAERAITVKRPQDLGWLEIRLDDEEMAHLWRMEALAEKDHRHNLAGNIEYSATLPDENDWFLGNVLGPAAQAYKNIFPGYPFRDVTTHSHNLCLQQMWVNYQKKHEFNPPHHHGGIFSFVVWMKIPTRFEEQNKDSKSNGPAASAFDFSFPDLLGNPRNHRYELTPEHEGTMLFFPSALVHQVFPFHSCDETRITISGNLTMHSLRPVT